jgi:pumilio RNA-binding family
MVQDEPYQRDMDRHNDSRNNNDLLGSSGIQYSLHRGAGAMGVMHSGSNVRNLDEVQNNDLSSNTYASVLGPPLSRSASPDPELVRRAPSPSLPPIGVKVGAHEKINGGSSSFRRSSSAIGESDDLVTALSGINLSSRTVSGQTMDQSQLYQDVDNAQKFLFDPQGNQSGGNQQHSYMRRPEHGQSKMPEGYSANLANSSSMRNQINAGSFASLDNLSVGSGFASPRLGSRSPVGTVSSRQNLTGISNLLNYNGIGSPTASPLQTPIDPAYVQYLAQLAASCDDPLMDRGLLGSSYLDLLGPQKAHLGPLLQSQNQYGYYGNLGFNLGYAGSPLASPVLPSSPMAPGSPLRHGDRNMRFPSGMRNFGSSFGSWNSGLGGKMDVNLPSLLEEFKSNKSKSYELSEIAGHVVEFRYNCTLYSCCCY